MKIPKLIHFIWMGSIVPAKNFKVILSWMEHNNLWLAQDDFKVYLWVDSQQLIDDYAAFFDNFFAQFQGQYSLEQSNLLRSKIELKAIPGILDPQGFIKYEINRLRPNYGAASDLLRYRILKQYGGVYLDSDVYPGTVPLQSSNLFDQDHAQPLLVLHDIQQGLITNDALIATTGCKLLELFFKQSIWNYIQLRPIIELVDYCQEEMHIKKDYAAQRAYFWDTRHYKQQYTPHISGPAMVRHMLAVSQMHDPDGGYQYQVRHDLTSLPPDPRRPSDAAWLDPAPRPPEEIEIQQLLQKMLSSIEFEYQQLGILRPDAHLNQALILCEQAFIEEDEMNSLKRQFFEGIRNFLLTASIPLRLNACELTFKYAETHPLLVEKQIAGKAYLGFGLNDGDAHQNHEINFRIALSIFLDHNYCSSFGKVSRFMNNLAEMLANRDEEEVRQWCNDVVAFFQGLATCFERHQNEIEAPVFAIAHDNLRELLTFGRLFHHLHLSEKFAIAENLQQRAQERRLAHVPGEGRENRRCLIL